MKRLTSERLSRETPLAGVRAIVTDADERLGLYVIRALGRAGCRVTAVTKKRSGSVIGFSSRYTAQRHRLPSGEYRDVLPQAIEDLAPAHDLLMPVSAYTLLLVAARAEQLKSFLPFFIPPVDLMRLASDKGETTLFGRDVGIPVPNTYGSVGSTQLGQWAESMAEKLPLVVKFKDDRRSGGWNPAERYSIVRSSAELIAECRRMHELGGEPLVQEYVEGDGYGFFTIMDRSCEPVATFCHRRLREYPTSGGPSTLCESVSDPRLVELGTRLLKAMEWRGVAMVEFKRDRATGEYKLLEINPRFWGSLPLALHCGVDFPVYQAQLALGIKPQPASHYPVGKKMRFFFTDFLAVRDQWRSGRKASVAVEYVKELFDFSIKDGLFEIGDPIPMVTYLLQHLNSR